MIIEKNYTHNIFSILVPGTDYELNSLAVYIRKGTGKDVQVRKTI